MTVLEIFLFSIGGQAALVAVLGWLAKSFVSNLLDKDIEKFKIKLSAEKVSEVEKLKHELQKVSNEHQVRFEKLHSRRDEVIANLYSHIVEFYKAIDRFLDFAVLLDGYEKSLENEKQRLWKAVDSFRNYSEKNRIYFSKEICDRLDSLDKAADNPTSSLMLAVEYKDNDKDGNLIQLWRDAKDTMEGDVMQIREALEKDFRELLGVEF